MKHYSVRTERAYVGWIRRFIRHHGGRHPRQMAEPEVMAFLSSLALHGQVAASTQNQALSAIVFLYAEVLQLELDWLHGLVRAKRPARLPVVLTRDEVQRLLRELTGVVRLMASLMYGSGLRLLECAQLRVKDVDLARREIRVRDGKGRRDRVTMIPARLVEPLTAHLEQARRLHDEDVRGSAGCPGAEVPGRGPGLGLAVGVPSDPHVRLPRDRAAAAASSARDRRAASGQDRRRAGRPDQPGQLPYVPALVLIARAA
jgi:integrase